MSGGLLQFMLGISMSYVTQACGTYETGLDYDLIPISVCDISMEGDKPSDSRMDMWS